MTPRQLLKRYLGDLTTPPNSRATRWLGSRLHDAEIWHLGRRSVAGGVGLGFFLAFVPLPIQMLIAAPAALLLRVNLPVAMASLWITNPITMGPMFFFAFKVGAWVTAREAQLSEMHFVASFDGMAAAFAEIWLPLLVGCFICGTLGAVLGNLGVRWAWRAFLLRTKRLRRQQRLNQD